MPSNKRLRSIAYSTAHHAMSGLCYLHPHLGEHCQEANSSLIEIDLLQLAFTPALDNPSKPLRLSATALGEQFKKILRSEHIALDEIAKASATFEFAGDVYPINCLVKIKTITGIAVERAVESV